MAEYKLNRTYNSNVIYNLAEEKSIKIAFVYDDFFKFYGGIPSQWIKVREWTIINNKVCSGDTISFYAVDQYDVDNMVAILKDFSDFIPVDVIESGIYTL